MCHLEPKKPPCRGIRLKIIISDAINILRRLQKPSQLASSEYNIIVISGNTTLIVLECEATYTRPKLQVQNSNGRPL
jgi:hypothetical protein